MWSSELQKIKGGKRMITKDAKKLLKIYNIEYTDEIPEVT